MQTIIVNWPKMKALLDGTEAQLSFIHIEDSSTYRIYSESWGAIAFECHLPRTTPPGDEQREFEDSFKTRKQPPLVQKTSQGIVRIATEKPDFSKATIITHDWAKPQTWYSESAFVARKPCAMTAPGVYATGDVNIIDCFHGLIFQEDTLKDAAGRSYRVSVWKKDDPNAADWTLCSEVDPHTDAGDFVVDYPAGTITFRTPPPAEALVECEYHRATTSLLKLAPAPGKSLVIQEVEINFAADLVLTDSAVFQPVGLVNAFAPHLMPAIPSGTKIPLGAPLKYKGMRDYFAESNKAYPKIPALGGPGWRGLGVDSYVLSWDYVSATRLLSSLGMEVHVSLEHDVPFGGSMATVAFYCVSVDE